MNARNWLIFGLTLMLALTLTVSLPIGSQAQQNYPVASNSPAGQTYPNNYNYNGGNYAGAYCPMGPAYGYYGTASQSYPHNGSRTRGRGYQGAWCPWNSGYSRTYRGGWGCW